MKVLGTPHIDHDPDFLECLTTNLDPGEQVSQCVICGAVYLTNYCYPVPGKCIYCSGARTSVGEAAREKNRQYGRMYQKERYKNGRRR